MPQGIESYLFNVFPVQEIELTVHEPLVLDTCPDWIGDALGELAALREAEAKGPGVYYQGLYGANGAPDDGSGGFAWVLESADIDGDRTSVAVDWRDSGLAGDIMAHELGHNMGRDHTFDDAGYPYDAGSGSLATWGYGVRPGPLPGSPDDLAGMQQLLDPSAYHDFMSYDYDYWVSDYTWRGVMERIQEVTAWDSSGRRGDSVRGRQLHGYFRPDGTIAWVTQTRYSTSREVAVDPENQARFWSGGRLLGAAPVRVKRGGEDGTPGGVVFSLPDGELPDTIEIVCGGASLTVDRREIDVVLRGSPFH